MNCIQCGKELVGRQKRFCSSSCDVKYINRKKCEYDRKRLLIFNNMSDEEQFKEMMKFTRQVMNDERRIL